MKGPITAPFVAALLAALPLGAFAQTPLPPDSAVRAILTERLPAQRGGGFVVGLLDADGTRRVVNVGAPAVYRPTPGSLINSAGSSGTCPPTPATSFASRCRLRARA